MRIISGYLGGRIIDNFSSKKTHPMSEKIRGALLNALGDINGLTVLDAFSGTGSIAIEAISRGAKYVVAIENDKLAHSGILTNAKKLNLPKDKFKSTRANISKWSDNNKNQTFDIVVCDPPYDRIKPDLIKKITSHVNDTGIFVLSIPPSVNIDLASHNFTLRKYKDYSDATLAFYTKK